MWQATNRWQAIIRATLTPHHPTHVQYGLLTSLVWLHGKDPDRQITQADLADFARVDVMMTSEVLRVLETKGLIERHRHRDDGRVRSLSPTVSGIAAANQATTDVEDADARFFAKLRDTTTFQAELARLS